MEYINQDLLEACQQVFVNYMSVLKSNHENSVLERMGQWNTGDSEKQNSKRV